jgi:coproporphyrinogen III oxidase
VIASGAVFEKGGVNTSFVTGDKLPPSVVAQRPELEGHGFFATGVSVVLHPRNPRAPTAHCNFRYFEAQSPDGAPSAWWFGGGADLTPYYPELDDVRHFHRTLRDACDRHDARFYPDFKAWCDRYFYLPHRRETRGVGGIFYDYLGEPRTFPALLAFTRDTGAAFAEAYLPLAERHALDPFGERERAFQLLRRGRYVEFNLVYDRGTHFGLQSGGRIESILMSLPPLVRWAYDEQPEPGSAEAALAAFLQPRDWLAE